MDELPIIKKYLKKAKAPILAIAKHIVKNTPLECIQVIASEEVDDELCYSCEIPSESDESSHRVEFELYDYGQEIDVFCPCDYHMDTELPCEHIYAAILALEAQLKQQKVDVLKEDPAILKLESKKGEPGYYIYPKTLVTENLLRELAGKNLQPIISKIWMSYRWRVTHDDANRMVSLKDDTNYQPSATSLGDKTIKVECTCKKISTNQLCDHGLTLLLYICKRLNPAYFRKFDDVTEEKNKLLAPYGLTTVDRLASSFSFQFQNDGILVIKSLPANIIQAGSHGAWEQLKSKLSILPSKTIIEKIQEEEFDQVVLLLSLQPTTEPAIKFDILGIRKKKTAAGNVYKKMAIRDQTSLSMLGNKRKDLVPILQPVSSDMIDKLTDNRNGNWEYLSTKFKATWMIRMRKVFMQLATLAQPADIYMQRDDDKTYYPAIFNSFQPVISFQLSLEKNYVELQGFVRLGEEVNVPLMETHYCPWFLLRHGGQFYMIDDDHTDVIKTFSVSNFYIPYEEFNQLQQDIIQPLSEKYDIKYDDSLIINEHHSVDAKPELSITLSELGNEYLILTPTWKYDNLVLDYDSADLVKEHDGLFALKRDKETELDYKQWMESLHPNFAGKSQHFFYLTIKEGLKDEWYFDFVQKAAEKEVELLGKETLKHFNFNTAKPSLTVKAGSGIDWFDVEIEVNYGGLVVKLSDLKKAILANQRFISLSDGTLGVIPEEWIKKYSYLLKSAKLKDETLQVSKFQWTLVDTLYDEVSDDKIAAELARKKELLGNIDKKNNFPIPKKIKATLRDYQVAGFQWLCTLDSLEWGGCLADDMGLGKTLQTLTFLAHINSKDRKTHLIVCPTSLIYNWESEILKFCKHLKYYIHYGPERQSSVTHFSDYDIIITSYGMVRSDIKELTSFPFHYVILDESHAIKNFASQIAKAVTVLPCKNKMALSGTPLQNNTMDIYSQLNFLNPGMLGSMDSFKAEFATPIDKHGDKDKIDMLRKLIYPFMLRRTKEQVAKDLPDKTETILWCEMEKEQRKIYNSFKEFYRKLILNKIDEDGMQKSSFYILEGLLKLRQICDSPAILNEDVKYPNESVKIEELVRELEENTGSHKALVFSQFVSMLKLVESELQNKGIDYLYLDGQTKAIDRKNLVAAFQENNDKKVMLISLKAGGVGLNLTAADYVYLIDPWWNPAVEQQAIDRTHRIGQTQKVFAYKMICKDSIEEKILMLQDKKKALSADIISGEASFVKKLTRDDIKYLFS